MDFFDEYRCVEIEGVHVQKNQVVATLDDNSNQKKRTRSNHRLIGILKSDGLIVTPGMFGPVLYHGLQINGQLAALPNGPSGPQEHGCRTFTPMQKKEVSGKVAMIRRGGCDFITKVFNAQNAGATAVVILSQSVQSLQMSGSDGGDPMQGGVDLITIPSFFANLETSTALFDRADIFISIMYADLLHSAGLASSTITYNGSPVYNINVISMIDLGSDGRFANDYNGQRLHEICVHGKCL